MNAHTYNAPTISAGTIARTACLLLALTNQVLSALGKPVLPIESQTVEAAGHRWHHHRGRAGRVVEEQQLIAAALQAGQTYDKLKAQGK